MCNIMTRVVSERHRIEILTVAYIILLYVYDSGSLSQFNV